jgi:hypothetical protein
MDELTQIAGEPLRRLAHDQVVASGSSLARLGLTRREAQVARLLARRGRIVKSPNSSE